MGRVEDWLSGVSWRLGRFFQYGFTDQLRRSWLGSLIDPCVPFFARCWDSASSSMNWFADDRQQWRAGTQWMTRFTAALQPLRTASDVAVRSLRARGLSPRGIVALAATGTILLVGVWTFRLPPPPKVSDEEAGVVLGFLQARPQVELSRTEGSAWVEKMLGARK